jgi:hypothetical protein
MLVSSFHVVTFIVMNDPPDWLRSALPGEPHRLRSGVDMKGTKEDGMEGFRLQLWLAPVRNTVWVAAHFGHR